MARRKGKVYGVGDFGFGDQGKGKVIDWLLKLIPTIRMVVRANGGPNAGHTITIRGVKLILHHLPSAVFFTRVKCVLGPGMVIDPIGFFAEIRAVKRLGISLEKRLFVSYKTHLIFPWHKWLERVHENAKGKKKIDTTGRGIGLAYADEAKRWYALRDENILDHKAFERKFKEIQKYYARILKEAFGLSDYQIRKYNRECQEYLAAAKKMACFVSNTDSLIHETLEKGHDVLIEGAQGALLDISHGTYPFVTSSQTTIPGLLHGAGIGYVDKFIAVLKAYTTRVGGGPFVGELKGVIGEALRRRGYEFGATTGRPRRTSWLDLVPVRYVLQLVSSPYTDICFALTKLDVLDEFEYVRMITHYEYRGEVLDQPPMWTVPMLEECQPVYLEQDGWLQETRGCRKISSLPSQARAFRETIIEELGGSYDIPIIGVGPDREETIVDKKSLLAI